MQLQRFRGQPDPYEVKFEMDEATRFYEQFVAHKAMLLSPFDTERLGMDPDTATFWAERGFQLSARNNGEFVTDTTRFDLDTLRYFGGLLTYFADTTQEELHRITNNNPPDKSVYAGRLFEAKMAGDMCTVIESRIKVPKLWRSHKNPVGFSRSVSRG